MIKGNYHYEIIHTLLYEINRIMIKSKLLKPTESEIEILAILWEKKNATVRMVHEELCKTKDAGYTTTLKLMQIMFEKKLVTRDDSNKTHIYTPVVSKEKTQKQFLTRMIDSLFAGSSADLVLHALGQSDSTDAELEKIQELIDELKLKK
ncbi:MAG: BlaI/MecI/CopY family transcriptional regulator [Ferruginibacter sp.]